jgi:hypothetical protein
VGIGLGSTIKYLKRATKLWPGNHDQVPRRTTSGAAGSGLGATTKYLRRTKSGAAGNCLGTTTKYLRQAAFDAADNGLGVAIKYLRGAVGIGLGTTIK